MTHLPGSLKYRIALAIAFLSLVAMLGSQPAPREQVGPLPGGGFLLNSGWRLDPVGRQVPLDTLPMSTALSPDGKYLLVLNGGYRPPSVSVIETASGRVTGSVPVADGWLGLAISPKGDMVYVGGGSQASLFEFAFANGVLTPARTFVVVPQAQRGDAGFHRRRGVFARRPPALRRQPLSRQHLGGQPAIRHGDRPVQDRPPSLPHSLPSRWQELLRHPLGRWHAGPVRYRRRQPDRASRCASARMPATWCGATARRKPPRGKRRPTRRASSSPPPIPINVFALGVTAAKEVNVVESINIAMTPRQPLGMTPSALGLSADGKRLFVACSDANAAAVVDIAEARSRVEGFIPTGWYPTAVRALANGTLVVLNGKGLRSYPNAENGPNPSKRPNPVHAGEPAPPAVQFVGRMQTGTASWIDPFTAEQLSRLDRPDPGQLALPRRQAG